MRYDVWCMMYFVWHDDDDDDIYYGFYDMCDIRMILLSSKNYQVNTDTVINRASYCNRDHSHHIIYKYSSTNYQIDCPI